MVKLWSVLDGQIGRLSSSSYKRIIENVDFSGLLPWYPDFAPKNEFRMTWTNVRGGFKVQLWSFLDGQLGRVLSSAYKRNFENLDFSAFLSSYLDFAPKNEYRTP